MILNDRARSPVHLCDGELSKIRMQESRVKISGRKIRNSGTGTRNGEVSRQTRRREIVGTVDAAQEATPVAASPGGNRSDA